MQPGNIGLGDLKFKKHLVNVIYMDINYNLLTR